VEPPADVPNDQLAYIIFTSGTTGTPKGVMIEAGSVERYCCVVQERCNFQPSDRVSQVAELTFDNSVLDMFVTWAAGAGVYVVPEAQLMAPAKFIVKHGITIWFSVPSTACIMARMKLLKEGAFPSLRCSIFAGEALPIGAAQAWLAATPNGIVENFYGPTEVTVDCIAQRLEEPPNITRNRGSLAIGLPFPGIEAGIVDSELRFLPLEQEGELVVSGRQAARGYFKDAELTAARFPTIEGKRWYRTGDLAYQDSKGVFHHLGRIDNQVKVLGNRVELEEVETHLREIVGSDLVAAVAWPIEGDRATGIVAFHCGAEISRDEVREALKQRVPSYMIPQRVYRLEELPLGATGKIDRKVLLGRLNDGV
jgi:amino acid adenylation domain-containing protein